MEIVHRIDKMGLFTLIPSQLPGEHTALLPLAHGTEHSMYLSLPSLVPSFYFYGSKSQTRHIVMVNMWPETSHEPCVDINRPALGLNPRPSGQHNTVPTTFSTTLRQSINKITNTSFKWLYYHAMVCLSALVVSALSAHAVD